MDPVTISGITIGLVPLLIAAGTFIITFIVKDLLTTFAYGLMFYFDKDFQTGDNVYLDGELATIINVKFTKTIFRMADNGNWRYVHNSKVRYLKLEKVIEPTDEERKKLKA